MKGHLHWIEKILDHQKHPVACSNRTLPTTQFLEAILSNIFDLLPVLDQVCFALTCKHFYAYFRAYLNNRKLFLPDLFRETRLILCRNVDIESRARTQLLRRLEDANWKYCFQCWTLHPHSAWQHPKGKSCLDCQQLNGRRCMPYAGIVDLYNPIGSEVRNERTEYFDGLFYHDTRFGRKDRNIRHECTVDVHPQVKLQIRTALGMCLWNNGVCLSVHNTYKFHSISGILPWRGICPHKEPLKWLERFFNDIGSSFVGWNKDNYDVLVPRYFSCHLVWRKVAEAGVFEVTVIRRLGNMKWPDRYWDRNAHF
ncbi:hypothetical protein MW887_006718 [Aspergillus wentii]|nr:hypothetical protein MW887_006718 [Aspergillus wentii]